LDKHKYLGLEHLLVNEHMLRGFLSYAMYVCAIISVFGTGFMVQYTYIENILYNGIILIVLQIRHPCVIQKLLNIFCNTFTYILNKASEKHHIS